MATIERGMTTLDSLKADLSKLQSKIDAINKMIRAAKAILKDKSAPNEIKIRARAVLYEFLSIPPDQLTHKAGIGYDVEDVHGEPIPELTPTQQKHWTVIKTHFDEIDFVLGHTRYDNYDNGSFWRRS